MKSSVADNEVGCMKGCQDATDPEEKVLLK